MIEIKSEYTEFGLEVKTELYKRRMTQSWVAKQLGVSDAYISNILKGSSCPDERIQQIKELIFNDKSGRTEAVK